MHSKKETISKRVTDFLEIPRDLVFDLPKLTVIGRTEIYLENHRGIIEYSLTRIRIGLIRGFMQIEGQDLEIKVLLPDEMSLTGEVHLIRYID